MEPYGLRSSLDPQAAGLDFDPARRDYFSASREPESLYQELDLDSLNEDLLVQTTPDAAMAETPPSGCCEGHSTKSESLMGAELVELRAELARLEAEIVSLRHTLAAKEGRCGELRRRLAPPPSLGFKSWREIRGSNASMRQKTSAALSTVGSAICRKLRAFEGLMGSIKWRVAGGRELGSDSLPALPTSGDDPLPVRGSQDDQLPILEPE
ncbi:tumor protein D55 [Ochotona princeps]|uniref:tumor protein D55 n=1 Tax=Ochotona princeps TaxID=9978 RepID=UPI002714E242|nr:tumor protein D55 [Ochotona princeps]